MTIIKTINETGVIDKLCSVIEMNAEQAIRDNGKFTIGFSGGSLIKYLCEGLPHISTDWTNWKIFFCDERVVSEDSDDSTFGTYKKHLLSKIPLKESQFVKIKQGVSAEDAAVDYINQIKAYFNKDMPRFNMLLLGMGPDGHTCSLFPDHPLLDEKSTIVAPIVDSPKPPPQRITMTYPLINNAECCVFAISGEGKADIVRRILKDNEDLPAGRVQPTNGILYWIIDMDAAKLL